MSDRYEWSGADIPLRLVGPGTELGEDEVGPGHCALIIGYPSQSAYVIEATPTELQQLLRTASDLVRQAERAAHTSHKLDLKPL
jgi:hypothetical protein